MRDQHAPAAEKRIRRLMTSDLLPPDLSGDETENTQNVMTWTGHLSELRARLLKTLLFFTLAFLALYPLPDKFLIY